MKVYVISLQSATERREAIIRDLFWIDYELFDAIDFRQKKFPFETLLKEVFDYSDFSRGALGCLLSHRAVWKKFIQSDYETCLVLEDDVCINREAYEVIINELNCFRSNFDIFFLGANNGNSIPRINSKLKVVKGYLVAEPIERYLYCSYGYLITKQAALKLLKLTKLGVPLDYWGEYKKKYEIYYGCVYPNIIKPSPLANLSDTSSFKKIQKINPLLFFVKTILINIFDFLLKVIRILLKAS